MTSAPMSPSEVERKVRQLDNDMQAIYELLTGHAAQQARQLVRIEALDAKIDTKVDGLETRLTARIDGLETRFDGIEGRFDGVETTLAEVLRRLPEVS